MDRDRVRVSIKVAFTHAAAAFDEIQLQKPAGGCTAPPSMAVIDLSKLPDRETLDAVTRVDGTVRAFATLPAIKQAA